jgi:hypothetical protein
LFENFSFLVFLFSFLRETIFHVNFASFVLEWPPKKDGESRAGE